MQNIEWKREYDYLIGKEWKDKQDCLMGKSKLDRSGRNAENWMEEKVRLFDSREKNGRVKLENQEWKKIKKDKINEIVYLSQLRHE